MKQVRRALFIGIALFFLAVSFFELSRSVQAGQTYPVSGFVQFADETPVSGVQMLITERGTSNEWVTYTNVSGHYVTSLMDGLYRVKPIKVGLTFFPAFRIVTVNGNGVADVNFTAQE